MTYNQIYHVAKIIQGVKGALNDGCMTCANECGGNRGTECSIGYLDYVGHSGFAFGCPKWAISKSALERCGYREDENV